MAARAIWKGVIRFSDVELPVKLYSAVEDRKVHFRLLDGEGGSDSDSDSESGADSGPGPRTRVQQRMVDPRSGDAVPREETKKGFEVEPGVFVVLEAEELEGLQPEASRNIEITRFVDPSELNHQWYERPYYLGPDDGEQAVRDYFALAEALARKEKEGVARWVMRKKSYVGALRPEGDHLMLISLRHAGEVVPASALEAPRGRSLDAKEVGMAAQLIAALEGDFDAELYQDEYRHRVLELVAAKTEGKVLEMPAPEGPAEEPEDLMGALEASIARFKQEAKGKSGSGGAAKKTSRKKAGKGSAKGAARG